MNYWPGTNIPRSLGNAFDWRNYKTGFDVAAFRKGIPGAKTSIEQKPSPQQQLAAQLQRERHGGAYSKADKLLAAKPALKAHVSKAQAMKRG